MSKKAALSLTALSLALGGASVFAQSETAAEGFIEGSTLSLINRNFYFNRDFRDGENATGNGYSEEWAQGLMAFFESGYTQGSVGIGVDAFAMLGLMTAKPVLYVCNVEEASAKEGNSLSALVFERAEAEGAKAVVVSAKIESEIAVLRAEHALQPATVGAPDLTGKAPQPQPTG